ncbi:MAG: glycosyltransferase family 39 protein [Bacteroidales bacterium]
MVKKNNFDLLILLFILIVGSVLRFYKLGEVKFTHDEFSTFFVSEHKNLRDLWMQGVKLCDTHPPFIHTFYYFIKNVFGSELWIFKFFFVLMGIASIGLAYLLGKKWFSSTTGLLTAACIGVVQLTVMHSQIARMYSSGLFFTLCMLYFWHRFLFAEKRFWLSYIGFVFCGSLMSYNHHFTLLLLTIIGVSGLYSIPKKRLWTYVLAGINIFILYLPNLNIFFHQANQKGLSWLGKPGYLFLYNFTRFLFHYSWIFLALIALLVVVSLLGNRNKSTHSILMRKYCIVWFIVFFSVAFFYSQYVSPILQYSIMIFISPFLIMLLFSFFEDKGKVFKVLSVVFILSIGTYTLVNNRMHYSIFYKSHFLEPLKEANYAKSKYKEDLAILFNDHDDIREYYYQDKGFVFDFHAINRMSLKQVDSLLSGLKTNYLFYSWTKYQRPNIDLLVRKYFPYKLNKFNYFNAESSLLSKTNSSNTVKDDLIFSEDWPKDLKSFWFNKELLKDSVGREYILVDSLQEFPLGIKINQDSVKWSKNYALEIEIEGSTDEELQNCSLALSFTNNDDLLIWDGIALKDALIHSNGRFYLSYKRRFIDFQGAVMPNKIEINIWNPGKKTFKLSRMKVCIRSANPIVYGQLNEI